MAKVEVSGNASEQTLATITAIPGKKKKVGGAEFEVSVEEQIRDGINGYQASNTLVDGKPKIVSPPGGVLPV
jgi:hypothetical protein